MRGSKASARRWRVSATQNEAALQIADGRLVEVLKDRSPACPGQCIYYPGHRHVPAGLRAFLAVMRGVVRDVAARAG